MAVAVNTTGTNVAGTGIATNTANIGITVPAALSNSAVLAYVTVNIDQTANSFALAGLTKIGGIANAGAVNSQLWGVLAPTSGAKTFTMTWTGGATLDIEGLAWVFTGVDQTSLATAFTNLTTFGPTTGTNPSKSVTSTAAGVAVMAFATVGAGDITPFSAPAGVTTSMHGNLHSINNIAGWVAGTGAGITFTATEGTSQVNIGIGVNVTEVGGGGDTLMGQGWF